METEEQGHSQQDPAWSDHRTGANPSGIAGEGENLRQRRIERGVFEMPVGSGEYWIVWKDAGRRRHREKIGRSLPIARAAYQKRRLEIREGKIFPESLRRTKGVTFTRICQDFRWAHPNHWSIRSRLFSRVESWWPNVPAGLIGPAQIQSKLVELETSGRRGSTANRYRAILSAIFSWALRTGKLVERNPAKLVKQRREDGQRTRFLSQGEEARLLEAVRMFYPHHEPEVLLALHTGMRLGEQYGLKWEDVDLGAEMISIRKSKSGKPRILPINRLGAEALYALRKTKRETVCPQRHPRFWFERCCAAAGITGFRWHDLRHTFASRLAMQGTSLRAIQELLGHATTTMTMRYAHLAPGYARDAVMRLAGATSGATEQIIDAPARLQVVHSR